MIDPGDLQPDFLGFIERLRGGAIELDEEMLLITLADSPGRRRKRDPTLERLRKALILLVRHAEDNGVPLTDLMALLDETKRKMRQRPGKQKDGK